MIQLNEKEEKSLSQLKIFYEKYEKIFFILVALGLPLLVGVDLFIAFKFQNYEPIKSRDHFWLAGMFGSWAMLILIWNLERKKLFLIIQKLRK